MSDLAAPEPEPEPVEPEPVEPEPVEPVPVEERLADRLSARLAEDRDHPIGRRVTHLLRGLGQHDRAAYRVIAGMSTPLLDEPLRQVSQFANFSKPWFVIAGALALVGGPRGRRAAATGVAAIAVTSFAVNQPMKLAGDRRRPDREGLGVPRERWVRMPASTSFPSGHSASAAAFAVAVGDVVPQLRLPLRAAAAVVGFSRVYTGVHYPGDVIVGATVGVVLGRLTSTVASRVRRQS